MPLLKCILKVGARGYGYNYRLSMYLQKLDWKCAQEQVWFFWICLGSINACQTKHEGQKFRFNALFLVALWFVSSIFYIVQILVHLGFELVSSLLALDATELVTSTGNSNGSWNDKYSSHFGTAKEIIVKATFFFM